MGLSADPEVDFGVDLSEAAEPMNEPLRREIRRDADSERAAALPLQQSLGTSGNAIEGVADDTKIGTTCLGDHQPLPFSVEELQSNLGLKRLDLMADGALRDAEFLSGARFPPPMRRPSRN